LQIRAKKRAKSKELTGGLAVPGGLPFSRKTQENQRVCGEPVLLGFPSVPVVSRFARTLRDLVNPSAIARPYDVRIL